MIEKELKELIKLCRSNGVLEIKTSQVELKFSHEALKVGSKTKSEDKREIDTGIINSATGKPYTEEETLFYSSPDITTMGEQ